MSITLDLLEIESSFNEKTPKERKGWYMQHKIQNFQIKEAKND